MFQVATLEINQKTKVLYLVNYCPQNVFSSLCIVFGFFGFFCKWVAWDFYISGAGINGNGELKDTHWNKKIEIIFSWRADWMSFPPYFHYLKDKYYMYLNCYSMVGACGNTAHVLSSLSPSAVLISPVKEWWGSSWEVVSCREVLRWPKWHPFMKPIPTVVRIWKKSLCNSSCLKAGW